MYDRNSACSLSEIIAFKTRLKICESSQKNTEDCSISVSGEELSIQLEGWLNVFWRLQGDCIEERRAPNSLKFQKVESVWDT